MLIIRVNIFMKAGEMQDLHNRFLKQMEEGCVLLPPYCEVLHVDDQDDIEIVMEGEDV